MPCRCVGVWLLAAGLAFVGGDVAGGWPSGGIVAASKVPGGTPNVGLVVTNRPRGVVVQGRVMPGPVVAEISGVAEINVPLGCVYLDGDEVSRYLAAVPQPVSGKEIGLIAKSGAGWYVIFAYDDIGWVSEDEADRLDPDALLAVLRRNADAVNRERQRQGWSAIQVLGWAAPPTYDPGRHRLEWATDEMSSGRSLLEVNARHLGRRGVMQTTLVADPTRFSRTLPEYRQLMEGFRFKPGEHHDDYRPGERRAGLGLTALVVGGAGAVAVKVGAVRWSWGMVLLVAALAALLILSMDSRARPTRFHPRQRRRK